MTFNGVHLVLVGLAFFAALSRWSGEVPALPSGRTILASVGTGVMGLLTVLGFFVLFALLRDRHEKRNARRAIEAERRGLE